MTRPEAAVADPRAAGGSPLRSGPGRLLVVCALQGSVGLGLYQAGSAIYFVHVAGLSGVQVGWGLSAAGLAGLALGIPIGRLADRLGPREVAIGVSAAKAISLALLPFPHGYPFFLVVLVAAGIADAGWHVSNEAVIAGTLAGAERLRVSAWLRSTHNIGMTAGALLAGLALAADTGAGYRLLFWGYALTTLATAAAYLRLPRIAATPAATGGTAAASDRAYLAVAVVSSATLLSDTVLEIGLPLWVLTQTSAPRSLSAWLFALNTCLVIALQVRAARSAETLPGAVRTQRLAFLALIAMCLLGALTGDLPTWPTVALLAGTVCALTAGEMWGAAARWALRFSLAPDGAQGRSGGLFRLGQVGPRIAGPIAVTALLTRWHAIGWLVLAAFFAAALLSGPPVAAWASRTRQPTSGGTPR